MKTIQGDMPIRNSNWIIAHAIENTGNVDTTMKVFHKTNFVVLSSELNHESKFLSKWNLSAPSEGWIAKNQPFFFSK